MTNSDAASFLDVMRLATAQAGAVALHLRGEVANRGKDEATPESAALTAVDLATQDVILHQLRRSMPHVAVDAEEDTALAGWFAPHDGERPLVVLDPIDGTLNYAEGCDDFAVMGSLIERGVHTAAIIHFPVFGVTLWAERGAGCWIARGEESPQRVQQPRAPQRVLLTPRAPEAWVPELASLGLEVVRSRCSAVDSSAPPLQRAIAACGEGTPDRRRAVGFLLTTEAGGVVLFDGEPWAGEDTQPRAGKVRINVVGDSLATARRIHDVLVRGGA